MMTTMVMLTTVLQEVLMENLAALTALVQLHSIWLSCSWVMVERSSSFLIRHRRRHRHRRSLCCRCA